MRIFTASVIIAALSLGNGGFRAGARNSTLATRGAGAA
jgi:hypothetical protein